MLSISVILNGEPYRQETCFPLPKNFGILQPPLGPEDIGVWTKHIFVPMGNPWVDSNRCLSLL